MLSIAIGRKFGIENRYFEILKKFTLIKWTVKRVIEVSRCADATYKITLTHFFNDVTLFSELKNANIFGVDEQTSLKMFRHKHLTYYVAI